MFKTSENNSLDRNGNVIKVLRVNLEEIYQKEINLKHLRNQSTLGKNSRITNTQYKLRKIEFKIVCF